MVATIVFSSFLIRSGLILDVYVSLPQNTHFTDMTMDFIL